MFRFCVLGSGSSGNSTVFWDDETAFLVDAGFSCRSTACRLGQAGLEPKELDAVLISHEHGDHISGVRVIQKKHSVPMMSTLPVHRWMEAKHGILTEPSLVPERQFGIGGFTVTPFEVCHDASQTVGFSVRNGDSKVVMATDLGHVSPGVAAHFSGADAIIIESNHDVQMLTDGPYPAFLKKRIMGRQGHLSNLQSAEMLVDAIGPRTGHVVLAHLSEENNRPELAREDVGGILRAAGIKVCLEPSSQCDLSNIIKIG